MKINILSTGSKCNCVLATFADGRKIMFDFGTGALEKCLQEDFRGAKMIDFKTLDDVLITHAHKDHSGDFDKISGYNWAKSLNVKEFSVIHDVPNRGFIVMNDTTKEGVIYATDYSEIPQESFDLLLKLFGFKSWKWMALLELSYCEFLYNKLPQNQRFGLDRHCSDVRFFDYAKQILDVNPGVNIISMHASARQGQFELGANRVSDVCPPDWVREQMHKRFKNSCVRFGYASGMFGTFNFIERK